MYCNVTDMNCCRFNNGGGICGFEPADKNPCDNAMEEKPALQEVLDRPFNGFIISGHASKSMKPVDAAFETCPWKRREDGCLCCSGNIDDCGAYAPCVKSDCPFYHFAVLIE